MLIVREPDRVIVQASDNAAAFLNLGDDIIGRSLDDLPGDLAARIRPHLGDPLHRIPRAVRCRIGQPAAEFDGLLHRPPDGGLIVELERAGPPVDLSRHVDRAVHTILTASSLRILCDSTAKIFKDLTGYDRVMVYRFDDQGHGEVFSERRQPKLEAYLGNRYPASDIPQIARRLYERNRVRVLVDVGYTPVPLRPARSPITGQDLDMSMCFLRSMSPIHIQYLQNMGVGATLVVSLMVGGKLWGLIACHHYVPRFAHFEVRAVCELLAEAIGTRIAALESFVQAQAELSVRRLEQRMIEAISREGDWKLALFDGSKSVLQHVGATGAALLFEDEVHTVGDVPGTQGTPGTRRLARRQEPGARRGRRHRLAQRRRAAVRTAQGVASGVLATNGLEFAGRTSGVVPAGAHPHPHLGRRSAEAGHHRQQPGRAVAAPLLRPVASARREHLGALDPGRPQRRAADRRNRVRCRRCSSDRSAC